MKEKVSCLIKVLHLPFGGISNQSISVVYEDMVSETVHLSVLQFNEESSRPFCPGILYWRLILDILFNIHLFPIYPLYILHTCELFPLLLFGRYHAVEESFIAITTTTTIFLQNKTACTHAHNDNGAILFTCLVLR